MNLDGLELTLTPRTAIDSYNLQINQSTLDILSLILEFKVATSWQISRFLTQKDQSKYLYLKLHRMWQAGLLESFKIFSGHQAAIPLYYLLAKKGLSILKQKGIYDPKYIKNYPPTKALLSSTFFKHEAQVIELASMEAKNKTKNLNLTFKGELGSGSHDWRSDKNIEVFTPDYTVLYTVGTDVMHIYSECERTLKSKEAMIHKLERYVLHLNPEHRRQSIVRLIFQTPNMEQSFWLNILSNKAHFLQTVNVMTTNLLCLEDHKQFLEPIYVSPNTVKLTKEGRLGVDTSSRIKLLPFL